MNFQVVVTLQKVVHKYCKFLQLFTGRGIMYTFLGGMVYYTLWEHDVWPFAGLVLGLYVFGVGLFSTVRGIVKSQKLERAREEVKRKSGSQLRTLHRYYARKSPQDGMTTDEFNQMTTQTAGISFDQGELDYVFGALSSNGFVAQTDLHEWVTANYMTLL